MNTDKETVPVRGKDLGARCSLALMILFLRIFYSILPRDILLERGLTADRDL